MKNIVKCKLEVKFRGQTSELPVEPLSSDYNFYFIQNQSSHTHKVLQQDMAHQEEGWPLGLQPLNVRVGLPGRNNDYSGSISFNTILTGSPTSSTDSSSDLDTESTGSFFHDKSITLGSLIGVSSIWKLSKRSIRGRKAEATREKRNNRSKVWLFSLCSRDNTDAENVNNANNAPSLGHFLAVERRAASGYGRNHSPTVNGPDELALQAQPNIESNSLFINGCIAPRTSSCHVADAETQKKGRLDNDGNSNGVPVLLSCMCGQP
ncbi:ATP synthase subunit epsilon [Gossypium australe]|uniref:ATP synthase subunit epsilon n=1 Tax=Gossypium australe TaxID=47621 RepID=A0A5B6UQ91_9ROSI|nr:ATP synthase subunit epsilon [Gossypium australe]